MRLITSHENPIYKKAHQLGIKKFREKQGRYLVEGPNLVREALDHEAVIVHEIFLRKSLFEDEQGERKELAKQAEKASLEVYIVEDKLFEKFCNTESPQGIAAVLEKNNYSVERFFTESRKNNGNIIVLDRLQDPGNIGTILRTADGAGFQGAIMMKGSADVYSPKIVRAAAGTLFRLPLLFADTPEEAIALLHENGKVVACTELIDGKNYYDCPLKENVAIVVGNEGNGVGEKFVEHSDLKVTIPMQGSIESLNVAVAAGILIYESVRK